MAKSIVLAPEHHKIWSIFPMLLYTHDHIVMDKSDYDECQAKSGHSKYHTIVSNNLRVLRDEGLVSLENYKNPFDKNLKITIKKIAEQINDQISDIKRKELLYDSYRQYERSSLLKISFLSDNKSELSLHGDLIKSIRSEMRKLKCREWQHTIHTDLNRTVFNQYLWKSIASLAVSSRIGKKGKTVIYDSPEYARFINHFWEVTSPNEILCQLQFNENFEKLNFCQNVIMELTKITAPYTETATEKDFFVFLKDRKSYEEIRSLVDEIESLYAICKNGDTEIGMSSLKNETNRILLCLKEEMKKVKELRQQCWLPVVILASWAKNIKSLFEGERKELIQATQNVESSVGKNHGWFFALLKLFDPKRMAEAERQILSVSKSRINHRDEWWVTGSEKLPWYVPID